MPIKTFNFDDLINQSWKLAGADRENLPGLAMPDILDIANKNNKSCEFQALKKLVIHI